MWLCLVALAPSPAPLVWGSPPVCPAEHRGTVGALLWICWKNKWGHTSPPSLPCHTKAHRLIPRPLWGLWRWMNGRIVTSETSSSAARTATTARPFSKQRADSKRKLQTTHTSELPVAPTSMPWSLGNLHSSHVLQVILMHLEICAREGRGLQLIP